MNRRNKMLDSNMLGPGDEYFDNGDSDGDSEGDSEDDAEEGEDDSSDEDVSQGDIVGDDGFYFQV
jgi:hypothetical protein